MKNFTISQRNRLAAVLCSGAVCFLCASHWDQTGGPLLAITGYVLGMAAIAVFPIEMLHVYRCKIVNSLRRTG